MYIVTGGAGFIGSCFLAKLNSEGIDNILVVDNLGTSEKWKNLRGKRYLDYLHKTEFLSRIESGSFNEGVAAVIHLGACSSTTVSDAQYMMENNYRYTKVLAEWAIKKSIRFIYASSAATYGEGELGFSDADSEMAKLRPLNVYGYSKQALDLWALQTGAIKKMVGLKFFNVYGPNEYHKADMMSVICKAYEQINKTGKLKLFKSYRDDYGDGEQKRDFIYVKDCSAAMYSLIHHPSICGVFNLGTGKARSWNDLAKATFAAMGKPVNIEYIEMPEVLRGKYQYFTEAKMEKLRAAGLKDPFTSLEDGVKDYVQQYLSQTDTHL